MHSAIAFFVTFVCFLDVLAVRKSRMCLIFAEQKPLFVKKAFWTKYKTLESAAVDEGGEDGRLVVEGYKRETIKVLVKMTKKKKFSVTSGKSFFEAVRALHYLNPIEELVDDMYSRLVKQGIVKGKIDNILKEHRNICEGKEKADRGLWNIDKRFWCVMMDEVLGLFGLKMEVSDYIVQILDKEESRTVDRSLGKAKEMRKIAFPLAVDIDSRIAGASSRGNMLVALFRRLWTNQDATLGQVLKLFVSEINRDRCITSIELLGTCSSEKMKKISQAFSPLTDSVTEIILDLGMFFSGKEVETTFHFLEGFDMLNTIEIKYNTARMECLDDILRWAGTCRSLQTLVLFKESPEEVGRFIVFTPQNQLLKVISLEDRQHQTRVFREMAGLTYNSIRRVQFTGKFFCEAYIGFLSRIASIEVLDMQGFECTPEIFDAIVECKNLQQRLKQLCFYGSDISKGSFEALKLFEFLAVLKMGKCRLTSKILDTILGYSSLQQTLEELHVFENDFGTAHLSSLRKLVSLRVLNMGNCNLISTSLNTILISESLHNTLADLRLSNNKVFRLTLNIQLIKKFHLLKRLDVENTDLHGQERKVLLGDAKARSYILRI